MKINSSMKLYEIIDREPATDDKAKDLDKPKAKRAYTRRHDVMSSWIDALHYDYRSNVCYMRLNDGRVYGIRGMDPSLYRKWALAPSKGKYFHYNVKDQYQIFNH